MDLELNMVRSGGEFDVMKRRLQTYTLHRSDSGLIYVTDDKHPGTINEHGERRPSIAGAGFRTVEEATQAFIKFDFYRM